ncbi:protein jag [Miltoncostaea marina]|uniref:Jag family protein n=1 Tax=Miltoncostaea marina TaxID=2843215 RepID=UPI001C3DB701|nr:R3H domain-containing nucleic acid-binding protein [Miltoncostaea marina]
MASSEVTAEGPGAIAIARTLEAVVEGMGLDAQVTVGAGPDGNDLEARVDGEGTSALVGRGGETIDSLQYLLAQIASRAEGGGRRRVSLDADGYRARRAKALTDLAEEAAREAVEYGEEIELDAMTPHDRRIVHMALKDRTEVVTRSEGEEPRRRIIVEPAE